MILICCLVVNVYSQSIASSLEQISYDVNQRPRTSFSSPTNISVQYSIFKLANIDSMKQTFDVGLFIREKWVDRRLANHLINVITEELGSEVAVITPAVGLLWLPDTVLIDASDCTLHNRRTELNLTSGEVFHSRHLSCSISG
jgi:hypothetical protein